MTRDQLTEHLYKAGIETRTFFCPMNIQPCFQSQPGFKKMSNPVPERLWETGLYLPSSCKLTEAAISQVCDIIKKLQSGKA